ncbi:MAG: hypothetical protein KAQ87_04665 [Candidatus Pacebacteria bacterium]|nr:hypothetical protein [Candidatus Paceibacterota bacterium]
MNVHGDCTTPFVRIIDPQTGGIQQKPNMTVTASVCLNPDIHTGWGVKFVIDNGAAEQIVTLPSDGIIHADTFSAVFSGLNPADHVIEAFIVDDQNITVPGEETYHMISGVGLGDYYVAIGDSITYGVGDDYHNDDISQDWRNFDGGYTPILNDLLTAETSYAHTVINEGLPGEKTSEGASRLSNVIEQHSTAKFYLIQYGTNDRLHNLPSGFGTLPGQPGYAGSYKDFMQQMIDQITDAGANAYIAKVPSRYPELLDYAEYNLVIDELVVSNDITVIPPDFYAYFQNHPEGMSYDGFHPNGLGYQGMADLWFEAITNL